MNNRIGEKNINNFGSEMQIIGYRGSKDIDIYFSKYKWIAKCAQYNQFKDGQVKCPYEPRVYGIGYIGEGKYATTVNRKPTRVYDVWRSMLRRCYDTKHLIKEPTYINCEVCEEWHNFQNFAEWHDKNYYEIQEERMHLDKDILFKGNKIYSPSTCIFVPQDINLLFIKRDATRGGLPIGVYYSKAHKKYRAQCNDRKEKRVYLGLYNTPTEAFQAYKTHKEKLIKNTAEKYKNKIPDKLYRALLNYEVEIID